MPLMTIPSLLKPSETLLILSYSLYYHLIKSFILEEKKEESETREACPLRR